MKRLTVVVLLAGALQACGSAEDREADNASSVHFITFGPQVSGLVGRVKQPELSVCLSGVAEGDRKLWSEEIQSTILKWVRPLRQLTSVQLAGKVNVVRAGEKCDADVVARSGTHANTSIGSRPTVRMDVRGYFASYNVLLHEMGHAFALSDTYQNGQSGNCRPGQPQAVMCNTSFSDLQKDDIAGLAKVFKQRFPNDRPSVNATPDPLAEFGKMKFAVALGQEIAPDSYRLAVGLSGGVEQTGGELQLCFGDEQSCKASESGWHSLTRVEKRGDAVIFRDTETTTAQDALIFTVRYKNAVGAAYKTFGFRDQTAAAP